MTREILAPGVEIWLADCREMLSAAGTPFSARPEHGSSWVDHVITDPPYESHMHNAKVGAARRIRNDGHANPPPVDFDSIDGIREAVTAPLCAMTSGWFIAFCTPEGIAPWRDAIEAAGVRYKRACFWVKPDAAPQFNGQGPAMGVECFVTAWCSGGWSRWNGGGRRNVFTHMTKHPERDGTHPTEKPLSLMGEIVELFTDPGQVILDPFMGSGSTGVACIRLGRRFIGIEANAAYYEIAKLRLLAALAQPDMFVPRETVTQAPLPLPSS